MQAIELTESLRLMMSPAEHLGVRHRIFPKLLTHLWLAYLAPGNNMTLNFGS